MKANLPLKFAAVAALSLSMTVGCSHFRNKTEKVGQNAVTSETEKVAERRGDHVVSTISFNENSADLTPESQAELDRAISSARSMGEIDDVTVAVWSDMEYPAGKDRRLPASQVRLAERRGDAVEDYLAKELNVSSYRVGVHNMAERPNFIQEFFKTADADLKDELTAQGIAPASEGADIQSHTSSALVFIKLKSE